MVDATQGGAPPPRESTDESQEHGVVRDLVQAAENVIAYIDAMSSRPRNDLPLAVATFAAHEATRNPEVYANPTIGKRYKAFLWVTGLSPLCVAALPKVLHSAAWDAVGLLSTMLLLYLTYGFYTWRMLKLGFSKAGRMGANPLKTRRIWDDLTVTGARAEGHDQSEAIVALTLLVAGTLCFAFATYNWFHLVGAALQLHRDATTHLQELTQDAYSITVARSPVLEAQRVAQLVADHARYASTYCWYFGCVWMLALLFIGMDYSVAMFNASHSETYIAASSAWFVTIPMFMGVSLVAFYLLAEWSFAWMHGANSPIADLSVEFASGALTFQMMLSNIVFVVMKRNVVFRALYNSVETTWRP
ncbi:MAG: hypothetical protein QOG72_795 [Sphingomonadales bacterium]|nr:hypothetical protein [Sphingomonadales bacterium]